MSQTPQQPPVVGQVVNGHWWDGTRWVPVPQVGQVENGHWWDGTRWVPVPQVGQVENGHWWDGTRWVPLPQVGQVENGHWWDGTRWVPLPQVGQVENGHRWDGTRWVPLPVAPNAQPPVQQPVSHASVPGGDPVANLLGQLHGFAQAWGFSLEQKRDHVTLTRVIAERKAFLSTGRLEYLAKVGFDAAQREVRFSELLKESGSGLSGGGDDDSMGTGFGFQKTSYNTRTNSIDKTIEDQAEEFSRTYQHNFPYAEVRNQVRQIAEYCGFSFHYGR